MLTGRIEPSTTGKGSRRFSVTMSHPTMLTPGSRSSDCRSSLEGCQVSSESQKAIHRAPLATAWSQPTLRATPGPLLTSCPRKVTPFDPHSFRAASLWERSGEASSTTMTSWAGWLWASTESSVCSSDSAAL